MKEKIFVYTNTNCRRRLLDSNKLRLYFRENNYTLVDKAYKADIIIFVTCAYRDEITQSCLNKIKEFQNFNSELIVAGCLPEIEKQKLSEVFKGKSISTKDIDKIDKIFSENKIIFSSINDSDAIFKEQLKDEIPEDSFLKNIPWLSLKYSSLKQYLIKHILNRHLLVYLFPSKKSFYHVRISWGCLGNCSYCGIKKAIGPFHSKPIKDCINDFKKGLKNGFKDFVITADDVGAYGTDINSSFPELLKKIISISGNYKISIQDFDPKWVVKYIDELEKLFKNKKISSVNIALQSGCSKILKLMNRYSDVKKISDALKILKKVNPNLSLDMHYILGFPTETDKDFLETMEFIKDIKFDMGFIYRFSLKPGTKAESIEPKVNNEEITKRINNAAKILKKHKYKVIPLSKNNFYTFYNK